MAHLRSIYLDQPYRNTDLSAYFGRMGEDAICAGLHASYAENGIVAKRMRAFAEAAGVRVALEIESRSCWENPKWEYLPQGRR